MGLGPSARGSCSGRAQWPRRAVRSRLTCPVRERRSRPGGARHRRDHRGLRRETRIGERGGGAQEAAAKRLSSVGGASQTDVWVRRSDLPRLRRKDETARARHRAKERRSIPARHRRADRCAEAHARSRTTVLGKSCAPVEVPVASRRTSRTCARRGKAALRPHGVRAGDRFGTTVK